MPRSLADARISFGLVSIPVKLYAATQPHGGLGFNMLHDKCGTRIKQQLFCPTCEVTVERSDIVKGYEFERGKYVRFTSEELKALEDDDSTQQIDISEFVPVAAVDPVYYDKPYYLGADKHGEKAYQLLAEALFQADRVGIGIYSARGRNYLVMVRSSGIEGKRRLMLQEMLYGDEVRDVSEVPDVPSKVNDKEVKLALQIIEQGSKETFDASAFTDERQAKIQKMIADKVAKGGFVAASAPVAAARSSSNIIDLVEILKASLKPVAPSKGAERAGPKLASSSAPKARKAK